MSERQPPQDLPHLGSPQLSAALRQRLEAALARARLAEGEAGASGAVVVGFSGSAAAPCALGLAADGGEALNLEALLGAAGWQALPDPEDPDDLIPFGAAQGAAPLPAAAALRLAASLHGARQRHLAAALPVAPGEDSRQWLYRLLGELPGLLGVDHSAALLLPDPREPSCYVVAAERLFVLPGEPRPEHLVGLRIPCGQGRGGLLEAALALHAREPAQPYHLFMPEEAQGARWRAVGVEAEEEPTFARFQAAARRAQEGMTILVPLPLPGGALGFLSLNLRSPQPLSAASVRLLRALREGLGPALAGSPLFRLALPRLEALRALRHGEGARDQGEWIARVSPALQAALGAQSLAIGLLEPDGAALFFPAPRGWEIARARRVLLTAERTLAALSLRLRRPLCLTAALGERAPLMRWESALMVHEGRARLEDARLWTEAQAASAAQEGWRALSDHYAVTSTSPVHAGLAVPIPGPAGPVGVLSLDFSREAPWEAWSGFAADALLDALVTLLGSHLALLAPPDFGGDDES